MVVARSILLTHLIPRSGGRYHVTGISRRLRIQQLIQWLAVAHGFALDIKWNFLYISFYNRPRTSEVDWIPNELSHALRTMCLLAVPPIVSTFTNPRILMPPYNKLTINIDRYFIAFKSNIFSVSSQIMKMWESRCVMIVRSFVYDSFE